MTQDAMHKCEKCGLHYNEEQYAKDCYAYCKAHNACSIDITKYFIEASGNDITSEKLEESNEN
jgi:hypothetical protein